MNDHRFKFQLILLITITETLNSHNFIFQPDKCKLHLLYPQSNYINLLYPIPNEEIEDANKLIFYLNSDKNFVDDQTFIIILCDLIDFNQELHEFEVKFEELDYNQILNAKKMLQNLCTLIIKYIPVKIEAIEYFQLLHPSLTLCYL